jgi:hypothetical protein
VLIAGGDHWGCPDNWYQSWIECRLADGWKWFEVCDASVVAGAASWVFAAETAGGRQADHRGAGRGEDCVGRSSQLPDAHEDELQLVCTTDADQTRGVWVVERTGSRWH